MIEITTPAGVKHFVNKDAIAQITVAGVASQWHGTRCYVKLFDGTVIDCRDTANEVASAIEK